jgi:hypothetical protein
MITKDDISIPNLDSLDQEELNELARVFFILNRYCTAKVCAMTCRLEGQINFALLYEKACDLDYEKLPDYVKW